MNGWPLLQLIKVNFYPDSSNSSHSFEMSQFDWRDLIKIDLIRKERVKATPRKCTLTVQN